MLEALGNIFRIPELRQKILFTLIMFAVFRMGTHIPVPGVDPQAIAQLFANGSLFGLLDLFSGGAFSKFSIFAMSITPYINAAIIIQLLNVVIPTLEQWSKEGQEGHKKTTKVTRYLTVVLAFLQAIGMSIGSLAPGNVRSPGKKPNRTTSATPQRNTAAERFAAGVRAGRASAGLGAGTSPAARRAR